MLAPLMSEDHGNPRRPIREKAMYRMCVKRAEILSLFPLKPIGHINIPESASESQATRLSLPHAAYHIDKILQHVEMRR